MRADVWTREQLIVALNLYWQIPYNKISGSNNPVIKEVAYYIGRTPGALAYKLMNFTSLDPEKQVNNNKGKSNASEYDKQIWEKYWGKWEELANDSASILANIEQLSVGHEKSESEESANELGLDKTALTRVRINQQNFRQRILASYNNSCCITGLSIPTLLVASHIIPWAHNQVERLNPRNGLCLNALHDKAFDKGYITITPEYKVQVSSELFRKTNDKSVINNFLEYDNKAIVLPDRFTPAPEFLIYHNQHVFVG